MKVELKCKTLGFPFGEILEVGDKYETAKGKEEVTKKQLQELVDNGHAELLGDKVASGAKELKKQLQEANKEIAKLKGGEASSDETALTAEVEKLKGEATTLSNEKTDLEGRIETLESQNKELTEGNNTHVTEKEDLNKQKEAIVEAINAIDIEANKDPLVADLVKLKDLVKAD